MNNKPTDIQIELMIDLLKYYSKGFYTVVDESYSTEPPYYSDEMKSVKGRFICIQREGNERCYSWFSPATERGKPLLIFLPGYNATIYQTPDLSNKYNVLYISPLGYCTPFVVERSKYKHGDFPVLYNTVHNLDENYRDWVLDVIASIKYVKNKLLQQDVPLIFAGTSQGGGMSLVLGSILKEETIAVCADLPWLIGFSSFRLQDVVNYASTGFEIIKLSDVAKRLMLFDPLNHTSRLIMPTFVTASDTDRDCPHEGIKTLFDKLPGTKSFQLYHSRPHGYDECFINDMLQFLDKNI